jgi:hypothetical protein
VFGDALRIRGLILVALFAQLLLPQHAFAAPAPIVVPEAVVHAGESVELNWGDLPRGAEEMEILLSLDDGAHYTQRVTAEIEPRARHIVWRVPNVASPHARLRIRYGTARREVETAPSAAFEIIADASRPLERNTFHEGAWQETDGLEHDALPLAAFGSTRATLASLDRVVAVLAPTIDPLPARCVVMGAVESTPRTESLRRSSNVRTAAPEFFPLRI